MGRGLLRRGVGLARSSLSLAALAAVLAAPLAAAAPRAAAPGRAAGYLLSTGALVDPEGGTLYLMRPGGGLEAVDLSTGQPLWTSERAAKPLALVGDLLVAQGEAPPEGGMALAALDVRQGGAAALETVVPVPGVESCAIDDRLEASFESWVYTDRGRVELGWQATEHPVSGVPPEGGTPVARQHRGGYTLDLAAGRVAPLPADQLRLPARPTLVPPPEKALAGVGPGEQFLAADGRHLLVSERIADDHSWLQYRWTVYERATGRRLGELQASRSRADFTVVAGRLLYLSLPSLRRDGDQLRDDPLAVRAVDLASGQELWSRPLRDTSYDGPFPP